MKNNCGNCRYSDGEGQLLCCLNPPVILNSLVSEAPGWKDIYYATRFPAVSEDDFCGEHRPKNGDVSQK